MDNSQHTPGRADLEIVVQTERLARLLMLEFYKRRADVPGIATRSSEDPRARHCWQVACLIQEELTATDPENSVAWLDDAAIAKTTGSTHE